MKLNQTDMDRIIDTYWPKTHSRNSLYKMLQDAANLAEKALLAYEETQEPVASYQLSAPVQPTKPDSDFLPLPQYSIAQGGRKYYSEDAMHDYVIKDRAARQPVAGSVDTPEYRKLLGEVMESSVRGYTHSEAGEERWIAANSALIAHINALIAPAAPSGEAVAYADPMAFLNFRTAACTKEWMWAKPDAGLVPLYTRPAPRDVDAPIVLPEKPESSLITETSGPDPRCSYIATAYIDDQMDDFATAAVQKDRANWKETK